MTLAIDGHATGGTSGGSSATVTLTTANAGDIIVLYALSCAHSANPGNTVAPVLTVADTATLTWQRRQVIGFINDQNLEIWWAEAPSALTSDVITVTYPAEVGTGQDIALAAFGVSGANTSDPWDANSSLPQYKSNNGSGQPTATYSTTATATMALAFWATDGAFGTTAVPGSFTDAIGGSVTHGNAAIDVAYQVFSSAQTNATAQFTDTAGSGNDRTILVDAIVANGQSGTTTGPVASFDGAATINSNGSVTTANTTTDSGHNITTESANTVLFCYVVSYTSGASQSVSSVVLDPSGLNLSFTKRGSATLSGSPNMSMELWWLAPGQALSNKEIAVTMAGSVGSLSAVIVGVDNVTNTASPFDSHAGLPVSASNSSSATIETTGVSTTATSTLIISGAADTQNDNTLFIQSAAPFGLLTNLRNTGGSNDMMLGVFTQELTAAASSQTFSTGHSNSNWIMLTDAIKVGVVPSSSGTWASTEAKDTFSAGDEVTGTWESIEAADVMHMFGQPPHGTWSDTGATDTFESFGYIGPLPTVDGSAVGTANNTGTAPTSVSATLTTEYGENVIVVYAAAAGSGESGVTVSSVSDTAGLSWHRRTTFSPSSLSGKGDMEVWWAIAPNPLTADVITVNFTGGTVGSAGMIAFGIVGANTGNPWDANGSLPVQVDNGGSGNPSATVSTSSQSNTILLAFYGGLNGPTEGGVNSPLTTIIGTETNDQQFQWTNNIAAAFGVVTSPLSSDAITPFVQSGGANNNRFIIVDAIDSPLAGLMAPTEAKDSMSIHGGTLGGRWASTETKDRMIFSPYNGPFGVWDSTENADTAAFAVTELATTWDPATASTGVDFQNENLTVVNQSPATFNQPVGAKSNTAHSTGKYYAEFTVRLSANQSGVGIGNATADFADWGNNSAQGGAGCFFNQNGTIWVNGVEQSNWDGTSLAGTVGGNSTPTIVGVAIDLNNKLIWFQTNGGHWNGIAGANPATGSGGYDISGVAGGPMYLWAELFGAFDTVTLNAGAQTFGYSVPSGFVSWNSVPQPAVTLQIDGYATAGINETGTRADNPTITSGSVTLSTTQHNDVIVLLIAQGGFWNSGIVGTVTDTAGLTWKRRRQRWQSGGTKTTENTTINQGLDIEVWWAKAPTPLTNDIITVTPATPVGGMALIAFGVAGANTTAPWDTHTMAGGYNDPEGEISSEPAIAELSTNASNALLFGFHADTTTDAGVTELPWTYVASAEGNEVAGTPSFGSLVYQIVEEPQISTNVVVGTNVAGVGTIYHAGSVMFDSIVAADESGSADEIYWFWDGASISNIQQFTTTPFQLQMSYNSVNYNLMVLVEIAMLSQTGTGEVTSISESQGLLSSSGFERRSRVVGGTPTGGTLITEIWWGWMPMETKKAFDDIITINTQNLIAGDTMAANMWGIGGTTGAYGLGEAFWDPSDALPVEVGAAGSSPQPHASGISTIVPTNMLVAWTANASVAVPGYTAPFITLVQDFPNTVLPEMQMNSSAPPLYLGFEFMFTPSIVSDETAEFIQSPTPDGWTVIADAIPVGPPVPPTGVWDSTEAQDDFIHTINYSAIGVDTDQGWFGAVEVHGTWHSTDTPDRFTGAPEQAPYDGEGWIGWVPAFATWHSTGSDDQMAMYGWVIGFGLTGRWGSVEHKDYLSFSNKTTVTGTWASTETVDRLSFSGFIIPKVKPRPPAKRRLLIVT